MAAVARFAGAEPEKAVVEPEAEAVLTSYEKVVAHFEIVNSSEVWASPRLPLASYVRQIR